MRLTHKGQYAVAAMVDLSMHHQQGPVSLATIAERQSISLSYLEQLFRSLRENGLVRSVRGPGGGYVPAFPASEIRVGDIIRAVEEPREAQRCVNALRGCHRGNRCATHDLWESLGQHIARYLDAVTIDDVCQQQVGLDRVRLSPVSNDLADHAVSPAEGRIAALS